MIAWGWPAFEADQWLVDLDFTLDKLDVFQVNMVQALNTDWWELS